MRTTINLTERPLPGARQPEGWTGMKTQLEHWKPVVGYEGLYEVSDMGRVRSLPRNNTKGRILQPGKSGNGYLNVVFHSNGKRKNFTVHRLVAQTFIPNSDNLPEVNHKDCNPLNNNANNLEWCDHTYNNNYGNRIEKMRKANTNGKLAKSVAQKTKDGTLIRIWPSLAEIQRQTGLSATYICQCCNGKRFWYGNYKWEYIK